MGLDDGVHVAPPASQGLGHVSVQPQARLESAGDIDGDAKPAELLGVPLDRGAHILCHCDQVPDHIAQRGYRLLLLEFRVGCHLIRRTSQKTASDSWGEDLLSGRRCALACGV